jgi:methionine-rich copper-binding protein CopC
MFAYVSTASAHAELVSSSPEANSTLQESPGAVVLTFDEAIQKSPGTYSLDVTDASGASVTSGAPSISSDGTQLSIALQPVLSPGTYTVSYTNTAAEDGDSDSGSYEFYVQITPSMPATPSTGAHEGDDHTHEDDGPNHADVGTHADAPTTGLIVVYLAEQNASGVDGRAEILPVDGGAQTQIGVYLTGVEHGSSHMSHVHLQSSCSVPPAAHAADLPNVEAGLAPYGKSVSVVDIPFSEIADGSHAILAHAGSSPSGDKTVIACGAIPAQPEGEHVTPIALPSAGDGDASGAGGIPLWAWFMLIPGAFAITGGALALGYRGTTRG